MTFAENNRVSHRQLRRQIILAYLAPLLLCLPGEKRLLGIHGMMGVVCGLAVLLFYVIFLIRVAPSFHDLNKAAGGFWGRIAGIFFVVYVVLTAAFLLKLLEEIVPESLLIGVSGEVVGALAAIVCTLGIHRGIQKRGRVAEISTGLMLAGIVLMLVLATNQASLSYVQEMLGQFYFERGEFLEDWYGVLCAFAGLGLLPFSLEFVEKKNSAGRSVAAALVILCAILAAVLLLLPAVLGWDRLQAEPYPILPLLAGADLPGDVLARFDVVWMSFLLYGMLFSIGSLFYYGSHILQSVRLGKGSYWMAAAAYLLSLDWIPGFSIGEFYGPYVAYIFLPVMVIFQGILLLKGKGRKRRSGVGAALLLCLLLGGCAGVEPEKRLYPLAMAVDKGEDGRLAITYAMADLQAATGQEKEEESGYRSLIRLQGNTFGEIAEIYDKSQEKYLDLGHLQVVILSKRMTEPENYPLLLSYLKQETFVGENIYLFVTEDVAAVMNFPGAKSSSIGEYLTGIYENRPSGEAKEGVTLRNIFYTWYRNGQLEELPEIVVQEEELLIHMV